MSIFFEKIILESKHAFIVLLVGARVWKVERDYFAPHYFDEPAELFEILGRAACFKVENLSAWCRLDELETPFFDSVLVVLA